MMFWLGLGIFLSTVWACDAYLFSKGYDTFLFEHKTEEEKALRCAIVGKAVKDAD